MNRSKMSFLHLSILVLLLLIPNASSETESHEYYEEVVTSSDLLNSDPSNSTTHLPADDAKKDSEHWEHGIHVASIKFGYVKQPLIVAIFMIIVVLCKLGFHHADFLSSWMPESCLLIVLGVVVGFILHAAKVDTASFYYINPDSFFLFLLPPCILESAYGLHDPVFFENLGTIILFAIIGTLINCFVIGPALYGLAIIGAMGEIDIAFIECLVFSSLVVAVDPVAVLAIFQEIGVNSVLYFLVFGESLLNDAVTVVLYNTITTLSEMHGSIPASEIGMAIAAFFTVSLGGLTIGIIFGIISAVITRPMVHVRVVEPLAILSMAYASYLMAELFHFSGIISMIGCGLMQMQYAFHNISNNSGITIKYFVKMLSGACDSIIFMFLGIAIARDSFKWHTGFILWTALLCLVVRFMVTYGLTFIVNRMDRSRSIGNREQFIMAYGGLRGAVAFCLVAMLTDKHTKHQALFQTATLFVILFTVFIQGITIKPLVKILRIRGEEEKVVSLYQEINNHVTDHLLVFMEEVIGHYGHNSFQGWLDKIDDKYLKKILQRDPFTKDEIIMEVYQQIALQQHYESVYGVDTSSMLQLYQPELVANDKKRESVIPGSPDTGKSLDDVVVRIMQAKNRRRLTSMVSSDWDEEQINPTDQYRVYDTVMSLPPYMAKHLQNARQTKRSNSVGQEEEQKTPVSRWRRARNKLKKQLSGTIDQNQVILTPNTQQLRKWIIKASNKDAFARRTDRNLKMGDKGDLLKLLNDKQLRHNRYMRGQSVMFSALPSPMRSRSSSLDQMEMSQEGNPRLRSNTQEQLMIRKKHKTVDFDENLVPGKYLPRYQQRRPTSSQVPYYGLFGSGDSRLGEHSPLIHSPAIQELNEDNGTDRQEASQGKAEVSKGPTGKTQDSVEVKTRSPLKRQDADGGKIPKQRLEEEEL